MKKNTIQTNYIKRFEVSDIILKVKYNFIKVIMSIPWLSKFGISILMSN